MKKSLQISANLDQPELLENLVEKLACRRYDIGFRNETMPDGREALEVASSETYVSGGIMLDDINYHIHMPFITSFLFTCIKGNDEVYKLAWSTSLS
jgi:hypothetical protein